MRGRVLFAFLSCALLAGVAGFRNPLKPNPQVLLLYSKLLCGRDPYRGPVTLSVFDKYFLMKDQKVAEFKEEQVYGELPLRVELKSLLKLRPYLQITHRCGVPPNSDCSVRTTFTLEFDANNPFDKVNEQRLELQLFGSSNQLVHCP